MIIFRISLGYHNRMSRHTENCLRYPAYWCVKRRETLRLPILIRFSRTHNPPINHATASPSCMIGISIDLVSLDPPWMPNGIQIFGNQANKIEHGEEKTCLICRSRKKAAIATRIETAPSIRKNHCQACSRRIPSIL